MMPQSSLATPSSPSALRAMYDVTATRRILVTGATGFVGHHVVLELLQQKWHQVLCLSRAPNARVGLLEKLSALPGWDPVMADRVVVLSGDITHPDIFTGDDAALADNVDTVLHAAAEVRWTEGYASCRQAHVEGTRNLLAFAARGRRKSFIYISSMAALHWLDPSGAWNDEAPDGSMHQKALDWGYARGKRVAETLVQHARNGGLAARIVRPGLVWGHSATGHAKGEGVLAAMLRACIHMGLAPDLDWHIDACPVDIVARAIAALCATSETASNDAHDGAESSALAPWQLHVVHPQGCHWRRWALWLDLHGYPMRLVSSAQWRAQLASDNHPETAELRTLLPFFEHQVGGTDANLSDWYALAHRPARCQNASEAWLCAQGITIPPLGDAYMARVTAAYVAQGRLPAPQALEDAQQICRVRPSDTSKEDLLREAVQRVHPQARIDRIETFAGDVGESIMLATTAVRYGESAALLPYRLHGAFVGDDGQEVPTVEVMFKRKPHADAMCEVIRRLAAVAHPDTGLQIARAMPHLDVDNCHQREIGIYQRLHAHNARYVPRLWGCLDEPARQVWLLVIGFATQTRQVTRLDTHVLPLLVRALAHLHAPWLERYADFETQAYMGKRRPAAQKVTLLPCWEAKMRHTAAFFPDAVPGASEQLPQRVLEWLMPRWHELDEVPQTLIHNDCAPRNSMLVDGVQGVELCLYDWELAKIGAPQQDLVSYLCLGPELPGADAIAATIEAHRQSLAETAALPLDRSTWQRGVQLALADLLIDRLSSWAMLHYVRPDPLLPQALRNWWRLAQVSGLLPLK